MNVELKLLTIFEKRTYELFRPVAQTMTVDGVTKTISEWANSVGMNPRTLRQRYIYKGWDAETALYTPVRKVNK